MLLNDPNITKSGFSDETQEEIESISMLQISCNSHITKRRTPAPNACIEGYYFRLLIVYEVIEKV